MEFVIPESAFHIASISSPWAASQVPIGLSLSFSRQKIPFNKAFFFTYGLSPRNIILCKPTIGRGDATENLQRTCIFCTHIRMNVSKHITICFSSNLLFFIEIFCTSSYKQYQEAIFLLLIKFFFDKSDSS